MRFIAIISVVAIITVGVLIGLLIQRLKNRQSEELTYLRDRMDLAQNQVAVGNTALRTIRDLQGDSSFDAQIALDKIEQLREEYYNNQGKGITR